VSGQPHSQRSWLSANWWWSVPLGCLVAIALCISGCGACFWSGFGYLKQSFPVDQSVELVRQHRGAAEALGEPIEARSWRGGSFTVDNDRYEMQLPIEGSKRSGKLMVEAVFDRGAWQFQRAELELENPTETIDLLAVQESDTAEKPVEN
jgi:hypothetical protein